jgi:hypothetical protein
VAQTGTHIVEIEGLSQKLSQGTDENCLLVPLVETREVDTCRYHQRYVYIHKHDYKSLSSKSRKNTKIFNDDLTAMSKKVIDLVKFDLEQYSQGLMFVFRESNKFEQLTIVQEYDCTEPLEHWQLNGTVMSHWVLSENTYSVSKKHIEIMENVYGHRGFNRNSVDCIGINVYTGIKSSPRVIANPL